VLKLFKRAAARRDLVDHAVYLGTEGGEELAERFLSQAEASFAVLLDQPQIGSPIAVRDPDLAGIRKWPVKDFESFLVFYLPHDRGVTIVRVLHARQDWWRMLGVV
jgi:toxin ParE1/3/4